MASVSLTPLATSQLNHLLERELPATARQTIRDRLALLETFPGAGTRLEARAWQGARVLVGPWWFVFVYVYDQRADAVAVTTIQDSRSSVSQRLLVPAPERTSRNR